MYLWRCNFYSAHSSPICYTDTHLGKRNIFYRESGAKLWYIEMKVVAEDHSVVNENEEFEEFWLFVDI